MKPIEEHKERMITHHYADVNDVRLHYAAAGAGELILFLHGFPEFWYAWRRQLTEFGRDHRAVAPDMRGYNLSSKPPDVEQYRVRHLVEDVRALVDHLGYERLTLVGHDWGGVVAWVYALSYPMTLAHLIIVNAPHPAVFARELRTNPRQQKASQYMLQFRSAGAEELLAADHYSLLQEMVLADGLAAGHLDEDDRHAYLQAWSQPGALTGGLNWYRASGAGPPDGEADAVHDEAAGIETPVIDVPTLVIWGERDRALLTGNLDGLEHVVSDLRIHRIAGGSHWVVHEYPDAVNRVMREHIAPHARRRTPRSRPQTSAP